MKSKRMTKKDFMKNITALAAKLSTIQKQAEKLGIFTGTRDLLHCKKCGLMEDILCDGRLVTCYE
ncbi:MAG: hypothetical protein KKD90_00080, partial [Candidatus Omnitrophica bacterium]|nr:hypothetical protein [Candidatus Omnitrophota bacterium]